MIRVMSINFLYEEIQSLEASNHKNQGTIPQ